MEYTKFKAETIQPNDKIQGFAEFLGYEQLKLEEETHKDYVARKFKEHADNFTTQWANHRIREATEAYKEQLEEQVIKPIKDSTIVTYEESN